MTIPPLFCQISNEFKLSTFSLHSLGEVLDKKHRGAFYPKGGSIPSCAPPEGFLCPGAGGGANLPLYIQIAVDYHLGGGSVGRPL